MAASLFCDFPNEVDAHLNQPCAICAARSSGTGISRFAL
jgi:hypothetical protein